MLSKINNLRTQKGSLMIEALAMLGLISMVTPVIYKKAAERTTEMQDINAASQVRVIVKAIDDYLRDNYTTITAGETVTSNSAPSASKSVDYGTYGFGAADSDTTAKTTDPINIEHFRDYLPLGFQSDGKIFKQFDVVIKQTRDPSGERKALTTVMVAKTNVDGSVDPSFTRIRSARIASMIGTNGGFVNGDKATGVQGVWEIPKSDLPSSVQDGTIVATSIEAVADGTAGGKNVLHRVATPGREIYNTMETALNMGSNDINHLTNLIAAGGSNNNKIMIKAQSGSDNALLHVDGQGLIDSTLKAAGENFIAEAGYMQHKKQLYVGDNATTEAAQFHVDGSDGSMRALNGHLLAQNEGDIPYLKLTGSNDETVMNANENLVSFMDTQFKIDSNANTTIDGNVLAAKVPAQGVTAGWDAYNFNLSGADASLESRIQVGKKLPSAPNYRNEYNLMAAGDYFSVETGVDIAKLSAPINGYNYGVNVEDSGNLTANKNFDAAYNTAAGAYNLMADPNNVKAGISANVDYPGYNMEVSDSETNSVKLGATLEENRGNGWKTHNMVVGNDYATIEGDFSVGKPTTVGSVYNMNVNSSFMTVQSPFEMQKLANGRYNVKAGNYGNGAQEAYFMAGYNPNSKGGNGYSLEAQQAQVVLGDAGQSTLIVSNYNNDGGWKDIRMGFHGTNDYGDVIFSGDTEERGKVHLRKGYISLARDGVESTNLSTGIGSGFIQADRLISNVSGGDVADATSTEYDYEINPAYTSMMHDIKLSSRGGARLSDILPDFINKGIYVMDNTYYVKTPGSGNWAPGGNTPASMNGFVLSGLEDCGSTTACDTSPWLGFIPAPNCPPGYMKVATIAPIRFAMAQSGVPVQVENDGSGNTGGILGIKKSGDKLQEYRLLNTRKDPRGDNIETGSGSNYSKTGDTIVAVFDNGGNENIKDKDGLISATPPPYWATVYNSPYTFQVSTWLNTTIKAHYTSPGTDSTFKGWHGIMGFIYPAKDYVEYAHDTGIDTSGVNDNTIFWNLFPVYKEELSAIATVYCYFNRTDGGFDSQYVDKYLAHKSKDVGSIRNTTKTGNVYDGGNATAYGADPSQEHRDRLNDPLLGYTSVW